MGGGHSSATAKVEDHYKLGARIGEPGAFGYAVRATSKADNSQVAIKVITKKPQMDLEGLRAEMKVMAEIGAHPNIIQATQSYESKSKVYIVMELCTGGELFDAIVKQSSKHNQSGAYSEADCATILKQLFEGLGHMHDKKIAHCDLKPSNFLFTDDSDTAIKIIDFGMAKHADIDQPLHQVCGTWHYMAPEVFEGNYSYHCDVWSMGVVMFVMLFGFLPFHGRTDPEIRRSIRKGFLAEKKAGKGAWFPSAMPVSAQAEDLLTRLLEKDPVMRFTVAEALEHPFLNGECSDLPIVQDLFANLQELTRHTNLQATILKALADIFSEAEVEGLRTTFADLDADKDGEVTIEEVKKLFAEHPSYSTMPDLESHITALMENADTNHNGKVDWQEMMVAATHHKLVAKEERLKRTFDQLDEDGDGKITAAELVDTLGVEAGEVNEYLNEVDLNADGTLDYEEFRHMFIRTKSFQPVSPPRQPKGKVPEPAAE